MSALRAHLLSVLGVLLLLGNPGRGLPQAPLTKPQPPRMDRHGQPLPPGAVARLGTTLYQHPDPIGVLGFVGDSRKLVCVTDTGHARLWDLSAPKELRRWRRPADHFLAPPSRGGLVAPYYFGKLALAGDGKTIAWRHAEGDLIIADVVSGKELSRLTEEQIREQSKQQNDFVRGNYFLSHDGKLLILSEYTGTSSLGRKLSVWRALTGELLSAITVEKGMSLAGFALSANGATLATIEKDNRNDLNKQLLRLWNAATGKEIRRLDLTHFLGSELQFAPGNQVLAVQLYKVQGVTLVNVTTGKELRTLTAEDVKVQRLLFSADGKHLFGVGSRQIVLWDTGNGKELRRFPSDARWGDFYETEGNWGEEAPAIALTMDGTMLAVPAGVTFRLWDVATGKELSKLAGHRNSVVFLAFAPTGKQFLTGSADAQVLLWDAETGQLIRELSVPPRKKQEPDEVLDIDREGLFFDTNQVRVAFAPDGKTALGRIQGRPLQRWEVATGKHLPWMGVTGRANAFAYSPDGKFLALGVLDGQVHLLRTTPDNKNQKPLWSFPSPKQKAKDSMVTSSMTFTRDGKTLLVAGIVEGKPQNATCVCCFEVLTGHLRLRIRTNLVSEEGYTDPIHGDYMWLIVTATPSPDGRYLATSSFSAIRLWEMATAKEVRMFGGKGVDPRTATFSPDGKLLLAGGRDGNLRIWELATGTILRDLPVHEFAVTSLAFSPDGKVLATGSRDTTVLLWDWAQLRQQTLATKPKGSPSRKQG